MSEKKKYVQFSKKIVVAVTVFVSVICLMSIVMMYCAGQVQYMADVIKMYIAYAMVVFAAYSGNSAFEKAVTKGYLKGAFGSNSAEPADESELEEIDNG